jgi:hypothetical protein
MEIVNLFFCPLKPVKVIATTGISRKYVMAICDETSGAPLYGPSDSWTRNDIACSGKTKGMKNLIIRRGCAAVSRGCMDFPVALLFNALM